MRRRNCSLTESLEPRLVLSAISPRGGVDPPRDTFTDSTPPDDNSVAVPTRDSQGQVSKPQLIVNDVSDVPVARFPVFTPVVSTDAGTTILGGTADADDDSGIVVTNARTVLLDGGTVDGDLTDDSLSTDGRTSVLVDSLTDADGTRADDESDAEETVDVIAADRVDSSSESPPASSTDSVWRFTVDASVNVRSASGVRSVFDHAEKTLLPAVSHTASPLSESSAGNESPSWIASLTDSVKSWLKFEGLETGTAATMTDSSVPYVALAGGFSLVAVGRKGFTESDAFEADEPGVGSWKPDRRSGRVTDRRRFRWFGFTTKDRRNRPGGEVTQEQPESKQNLSEPDISEAFAMSLMQSVGENTFKLSPMPSRDELPDESSEDSSLSIELVAAGAVTIAGGTMVGRSRNSKTLSRPTFDYSGTTLPRC